MRSLLALLLAAPPPAALAQEGPTQLERIDPVPLVEEPDPLQSLFGRAFDPSAWRELLAEPDLDVREEHFERLVLRAGVDPAARAFVEELAHDAGAPDLAWTARLALRELGAARPQVVGLGAGPLFRERFEELFRAIAGDRPELQFQVPPAPRRFRVAGAAVQAVELVREVHVRQGPEGARVEIVERSAREAETGLGLEGTRRFRAVDPGLPEPRVTAYEAPTLAELFERHPELAGELSLTVDGDAERLDLRVSVPHTSVPDGGASPFRYGDRRAEVDDPSGWLVTEEGSVQGFFSPTGVVPVRTDVLGVRVAVCDPETRQRVLDQLGVDAGLRVTQLEPGTIADQLGVRSGDVLVRLNGLPLREPEDITRQIEARQRMEPVTLVWIDDLGMPIRGRWTPE